MDNRDYFFTPLQERLLAPSAPKKYTSICFWTDLLGFSAPLLECNWKPSDELWTTIVDRLRHAHGAFTSNVVSLTARTMILNDGLGCVLNVDKIGLNDISWFLMTCIRAHIEINMYERQNGLPGARSVLAYGEGIEYFPPSITADDYIFRYTRKNPMEMSVLAKTIGNPTIVYNPVDFQMNTAFSKAFLIDEIGSGQQISGNMFYIDQSFFDMVTTKASFKSQIEWTEGSNNDVVYRVYSDPSDQNHAYFGFRMTNALPISSGKWKSNAYRIIGYSPVDEPLPFEIALDQY